MRSSLSPHVDNWSEPPPGRRLYVPACFWWALLLLALAFASRHINSTRPLPTAALSVEQSPPPLSLAERRDQLSGAERHELALQNSLLRTGNRRSE